MEKADLNCIVQTVTITRELGTLERKISDKMVLNNVHLQPFRQYCCHKDPQIAKISCDFITKFVVQKKLSITEAISWFISSLQSSENVNVIIMTIRDLLLLNFHLHGQNSHFCSFGLLSPQHPFILILKEDNSRWPIIDCHIQYMLNSGNVEAVISSLSPFFKYVLWSPPGSVDHGCRRSTWNLLVNYFTCNFSNFVSKTLCWLRTDEENSVINVNFYLSTLLNVKMNIDPRQKSNFICVLSAEIACKTAKSCQDPSFALVYMKELLKKYPETTDLILILIAESLPSCPVAFIADFLSVCVEVINSNGVGNMIVIWTIIGALLPWIIHSINATKDIIILSNSLFDIVDGKRTVPLRKMYMELLQNDMWFMECVSSYTECYWAFVIARTIEMSSCDGLVGYLPGFIVTSDVIRENFAVNLIVTAVFLCSDDLNVQLGAFDILIKKNAGFQLPLILFKLSRTSSPELHLKLLHSLPLTAAVKENIRPIIATIRSLSASGKPVLVQLSYLLYSTLWKTEERCYQFLSDELRNCKKERDVCHDSYQLDIITASVIRDICVLKPEIYGKEWVKELADMISLYPKEPDCLPLIIALEAVIKMCKLKTIDVFSVYEEFEKKQLLVDKRTGVIIQLCDMIGFIFQVAAELMIDSNNSLLVIWKIVAESSEKKVTEAALSALSKYNFEEMPLSVIPDEYKKNLNIPRKHTNTKKTRVCESAEETLLFIPGSFWITFLRNASKETKPEICKLLTLWLAREIKNFPRSIFHLVHRERDSVLSFHDKSIFKAIVNNCKYVAKKFEPGNVDNSDVMMTVYCMQILNEQTAKSLPPFNWSFLNDLLLYKNDELREQVLKFWAKESITCTSAKNCIEAWLKQIDVRTCDRKELEMALDTVCSFCIGVASEIVASFISTAMQFVLEKCGIEQEKNLYRSTCIYLHEALKQREPDEHNCEAICKNLVNWWENAFVQNECFDYLVDVAKEMPSTYIDYLSSLSLSEYVSTEDLYKILKLRCILALNESNNSPFLWLNDCIQATTRRLQDKILFFERTLEVFTKHRFNSWKWPWLLQFLDRIQVSADVVLNEVCDFKCDVFIFCVVNTSTYHPFLHDATSIDECYAYFPQALCNIMHDDTSSQVIEWLAHSCQMKTFSDKHRQLFIRGIIASRRNKYLQKLSVWSNVVQKL